MKLTLDIELLGDGETVDEGTRREIAEAVMKEGSLVLSVAGYDSAVGNARFDDEPELTFARVSRMSGLRCESWHGPFWKDRSDSWSLADWSNAMVGEAGEAANVVKKLRRIETGLWMMQKYPGEASGNLVSMEEAEARILLLGRLASELADVVLYADLLAQKAGIDLGTAVREKFNRVSEAQGFKERL